MGCCGAGSRVETLNKNGVPPQELPCKDRSIRDVPCLIIFVIFLLGGILAMSVALSQGSLKRLLHGYDNYGNVCGQKNSKIEGISESGKDYTDEKILLLSTDLSSSGRALAVLDFGLNPFQIMNRTCIEKCPSEGGEQIINYCFYTEPSSTSSGGSSSSSSSGTSGAASTTTEPPKESNKEEIMSASSVFEEISRDLELAWPQLLGICAVALALSLVLLAILRFFAWVIVYLVVAIVVIGALALTGVLWYLYFDYKKIADAATGATKVFREKDAKSYMMYAIVATIITVILLLVLFIMRKRIKLVTALFKEAGKAVQAMPLLLIQPMFTFLVMVTTGCIWLTVALAIESIGTPVPGAKSGFVEYRKKDVAIFFRWYNLFALFWVTQFILACQDMVIGGAVSKWFFTRDKSKLGSPILFATKNLLLYHLGSVALGSFIIAVVKLIRFLLKKAEKQMGRNPAVKAVCCCAQCCIWCLEKFLQFLNRNAYVEITIHGYNFCKAAQQAFGILTRNALRVAAINSIGTFVLLLGKLAVTVSTVFIGIEIMKGCPDVKHSYLIVALGALFAYIISYVFVSIYDMAIDALFICFCEDCEMNDGIEKPYYMSKGLMELVQNSKKALAAMKYREDENSNNNAVFTKSPNAPPSAMPGVD